MADPRQSPTVQEVLAEAAQRAGADRDAYLAGACGDDAALRAEVESLLAALDRDPHFMAEPTAASGQPTEAPQAADEPPPEQIGRYKLLGRIGEGGFGVVYLAEQQEPVRRKVALKVIKPGCDTRQVIARFDAERQALALMDHENIARVFDAGATDSGRPYFVMELVDGVPITEYCDRSGLTPRQRLELFVAVCRAVQHAHTKGVIHRDLKPGNVLVTLQEGAPVPKVIDFGIAKATGGQLTDHTLFTSFQQMVGTPLYMSPEQAEMTAADVDTRTDVYSLGVLLYELLTGTTPFEKDRLKQAAFDEVRRIIREEDPPRPSTRLLTMGEGARQTVSARRGSDPQKLGRLFERELDWVVMKALEKDRARRYETAAALAADVRHFLNDEPVSARPAGAAYRLRKLAAKHKLAFGAAAAVAAALVLGVAGTTVMAYRATRARNAAVTLTLELDKQRTEALAAKTRAEQAQAQAEKDQAAMQVSENEAGHTVELLDRFFTAARVQENEPDVTVRHMLDLGVAQLDAQQPPPPPRVEGACRHVLGNAYEGLGRFPEAETQLRKALRLRQVSLPPDHPAVAENYARLGAVLAEQGKFEQALPLLEHAVQIYRRASAPPVEVQYALTWLGNVNSSLGRVAEAEQYARETAELRAKSGKDAAAMRIENAVFEAASASDRGDYAAAERLLREAIDLDRQEQPHKVDRRRDVIYHNLGVALDRQGRKADAEAAFRDALGASEKLFGKDHPTTDVTLADLARVLRAQGKELEARAVDVRRVAIQTHALDKSILEKPNDTNLYRDRAHLLCRVGRFKEALPDFNKAIELDPADHWKYFTAAPVYLYAGDTDGYRRACREMVRRFGTSEVPEVAERVAKASLLEPDPDADPAALAALIERAVAQRTSQPYVDWFKTSLGLAEYRRGRFERAVEVLEGLPETGQMTVYGRSLAGVVLAMALARNGQAETARKALARAEAQIDAFQLKPGACDLGDHFSNWCTYQVIRAQARTTVGEPMRQAPP